MLLRICCEYLCVCVCDGGGDFLIREAQRKEMAAISFFTFFTMEKETDGSQKGVVIDC